MLNIRTNRSEETVLTQEQFYRGIILLVLLDTSKGFQTDLVNFNVNNYAVSEYIW